MNFKTTGVLLLVMAVLGGYVYTSVINKPSPPRQQLPFVYTFEMTDIIRIDVQYKGESVNLVWDEEESEWNFTDPAVGDVDLGRANGMRFLLGGPGSNRVLVEGSPTPEQLREFGLEEPQIAVAIALKSGRVHRLLLGDKTPDGGNYYIKNENSDTIYLVDYTWGDELARFVNEPPILMPAEGDSAG